MASRKLTPRQGRFVQEYLTDLNATQAAIRAGYSERTANEQGARLLANVSVREAIQQAQAARAERVELTTDWVLERLKVEALAEGEGSSHSARIKAVELIGKHLGMFAQKHEHSGPGGQPFKVYLGIDLNQL